MITSGPLYDGVHAVLGVASLIAIFFSFRLIQGGRARTLLTIALILIIVSAAIMPVCLRIYKLHAVVYTGEAVGEVEEGTLETIYRFKDLAHIGTVLELLAIILLAGVSKRLLAQHLATQSEEEVTS